MSARPDSESRMRAANDVMVGLAAANEAGGLSADELAQLESRVHEVLGYDEDSIAAVPDGPAAAIAVDTFNAELADTWKLIAMAKLELREFGAVGEELSRLLLECAELHDARRREIRSRFREIVF